MVASVILTPPVRDQLIPRALIPETEFHRTVYHGTLDDVQRLLDLRPAIVHSTDSFQWTALHWATIRGNVPIARLLLDSGAYVNHRDRLGRTPLFYALTVTGHL